MRVAICLVAVLLPVAAANGQIDKRVNTGNVNAGYARDANPMVGSGGLNLSRPGMNDPGFFSNAIISGNVTGLAGFRGDSPIYNTNQFRDALPSAGLSGFVSRSVSANDASPGYVPTPTLFLGRQETVTDGGFVRSGFNAAESAGTLSQNLASRTMSVPMYGAGPATLPDPTDRRIHGPAQVDAIGLRQKPIGGRTFDPDKASRTASSIRNPFELAATSPIFGAPGRGAVGGSLLMENPLSIPKPRDVLAELGYTGMDLSAEDAAKVGKGLNKPFEKDVLAAGMTGKQENPSAFVAGTRQRDFTGGQSLADRLGIPTAAKYGADAPPNLGADRFADLYNAYRTASQVGVSQFGFDAVASSAVQGDRLTSDSGLVSNAETAAVKTDLQQAGNQMLSDRDAEGRRTLGLRRRAAESISLLSSKAKWASDVIEDPITTFAGHYENDLNRLIVEGETLMHKGEYYRAAGKFDLARVIDPRNPLPLLGRGHAWIAAGDYSSGLSSILAGIERFPQIAAFRLDLPALVGGRDVFDRRRADLAKKLEQREDYELRFLLGYLELYSGLSVEGLADIEKAAAQAPAESVIVRFHDMLNDRGSPPALPE
ncbi:MAG: hypothetical protein HBSAPP02_20930 [Phycisphaerae bacterium]|nr:MAG: hypothetical protein DCC66_06855 [Planctomycetota bacterium]GJQ27061.1 MAG: hypothetical protein HBSAPP02_20930 [Phycisphaerae bacterium]